MPYLTVGRENSGDIEIYYEDHGPVSGPPVVLTHGYPLNGSAWEKQVPVLLEAGYRVILHDRRGWGRSSQPATGHDYNTFAADYHALIEHLELKDAVLVGHSMGTGEVTRYLGSYGSGRVRKAVLVSAIPPFFLQTDDNPIGPPASLFDGFFQAATADRLAWFKGFFENFYNMDVYAGTRVSEEAFQNSMNIAASGSPISAVACIETWHTDFRADVASFDVPILVIHGDADRVLPLELTGGRLPDLVKDLTLTVIEGGPHAIAWTHSDEVNAALLAFLK